MRLNLRAMAFGLGIFWGAVMLVMGLANLVWPGYGTAFLQLMASIYPEDFVVLVDGKELVQARFDDAIKSLYTKDISRRKRLMEMKGKFEPNSFEYPGPT